MSRLSLSERARLIGLLADRSRRTAAANVLASPLFRWRYGPPTADQLVILPQDLRTADPSFWSEISVGHFGLAGTVAFLRDGSPFDLAPPTRAWARELNGFGWLRHLDAARNDHAKATAVTFVLDWIDRQRGMSGVAWEPAVIGRRLISWISHAGLLLDGSVAQSYDAIAESLGEQIVRLSSAWRHAPSGYERLLSLTALVLADLCVADHDRQLEAFEHLLAAEIERQILPDGGHISRNPSLLVELLLDFLPLGKCFVSRNRPIPPALSEAIHRMLPMLRFMRLGDGALARFNGAGVPQPDALATVLAYDDRATSWEALAPHSRYARLAAGPAVVICDVGGPPPLEYAIQAHAGCLSFEMSVGSRALFINGGAPSAADDDWRAASRATASHSTLCLNDRSSSRLVRSRMLEQIVGAPPIRYPDRVSIGTEMAADGPQSLTASHDGYLAASRLMHTRSLTLSGDGRRLDGIDKLAPPHGVLRLAHDAPFAVHFHLHPEVDCAVSADTRAVMLSLGRHRWQFEASGARLEIEDSVYYSDFSGPRRTRQIVLRGATFGDSTVTWSVRDVEDPAVAVAAPEVDEVTPQETAEPADAAPETPPIAAAVPLGVAIAAMQAARLADAAHDVPAAAPTGPPPLPQMIDVAVGGEVAAGAVAAVESDFAIALAQAMADALEEDIEAAEDASGSVETDDAQDNEPDAPEPERVADAERETETSTGPPPLPKSPDETEA